MSYLIEKKFPKTGIIAAFGMIFAGGGGISLSVSDLKQICGRRVDAFDRPETIRQTFFWVQEAQHAAAGRIFFLSARYAASCCAVRSGALHYHKCITCPAIGGSGIFNSVRKYASAVKLLPGRRSAGKQDCTYIHGKYLIA
jgi:hypothetical protein